MNAAESAKLLIFRGNKKSEAEIGAKHQNSGRKIRLEIVMTFPELAGMASENVMFDQSPSCIAT